MILDRHSPDANVHDRCKYRQYGIVPQRWAFVRCNNITLPYSLMNPFVREPCTADYNFLTGSNTAKLNSKETATYAG